MRWIEVDGAKKVFFMTRNGKIARLPQSIREEINGRLQNGEEGKQITDWLNTLPKVKALMKAEFEGQPVSESNLSHWKLGGYVDWEEQQAALEAVRRFGEDAAELSQEGGGRLTERLAVCLAARVALALHQARFAEENPDGQLERLRRLRMELTALRRGDHNAEWLEIERGKLDLELKRYKEEAAERKRKNEPPKAVEGGVPPEVLEQIEKELHLL